MDILDIIAKKKFGHELSEGEIGFLISNLSKIPDYQTAAFLMAVRLNGMTDKETVSLTVAMAKSGEILDLSSAGGITVDKHSSGGVSDATTFITAPILAAAGLKVIKLSGRGLGHTGGTIDKLEAIKGFRAELSALEVMNLAFRNGIVVAAQSAELAPADKILYALRDVTSTVDSIPLIASSIMSKKIAGGAEVIVLDVKYGGGAFLKTAKNAEKLAALMVTIGKMLGKKTAAVITSMNQPLGSYIGSVYELQGAIEVLRGADNDLRSVAIRLAQKALKLSGRDEKLAESVLASGAADDAFCKMIMAQGGDMDSIILPKAKTVIKSARSGYIVGIDCEGLGMLNIDLGGGRRTKADIIDHYAGMRVRARLGQYIKEGEVLGEIFTKREGDFDKRFSELFTISAVKKPIPSLIYSEID